MNLTSFGVMAIAVFGQISTSTPATDNLLVNPSFTERGPLGRPLGWEVFVMPMDGATGRVDAPDGADPAAMLYNPVPYPEDPANNWSQSVVGDFEGAELVLRGRIKTEGATEGALWLQCWDDSPAQVIAAATSAQVQTVSGTRDWTPVDVRLVAPSGTDFVMVRCVLRGEGRVWFDDLTLTAGTDLDLLTPTPAMETEEEPPAELPDYATNAALREAVAELQTSNRDLIARLESLRAGAPDATPGMNDETWRAVLDAVRETDRSLSDQIARLQEDSPEQAQLAQENAMLRDALVAMEGANTTLQEQLREVRALMAAGSVDDQRERGEEDVARAEIDVDITPDEPGSQPRVDIAQRPDDVDALRVPEVERGTAPLQEQPSAADVPAGAGATADDQTPMAVDVDADTTADVDAAERTGEGDTGQRGTMPPAAAEDALEDEIEIAREAAQQLQARLRRLRERGGETQPPPVGAAPGWERAPAAVPGRQEGAAARNVERGVTRPDRPSMPEQPERAVVDGRRTTTIDVPAHQQDADQQPTSVARAETTPDRAPVPGATTEPSGVSESTATGPGAIEPGAKVPGATQPRPGTPAETREGLPTVNIDISGGPELLAPESGETPLMEGPGEADETEGAAARDTDIEVRASLGELERMNARLLEQVTALAKRLDETPPPAAPPTAQPSMTDAERAAQQAEWADARRSLETAVSALQTTNQRLEDRIAELERVEVPQAVPRPSSAEPSETERQLLARFIETNSTLDNLLSAFRATNENLTQQVEQLPAAISEALTAAERPEPAQRPEANVDVDAPPQRPAARETAAQPSDTDRQVLAQLQETNTALEELAGTFRATNENLVSQLERLQRETREARLAAEAAALLPVEAPRAPVEPGALAQGDVAEETRGAEPQAAGVTGEPQRVSPLMPGQTGATDPADATALYAAQVAAAQKTAELERALDELQQTNQRMLERLENLPASAVTPTAPQPTIPPEELLAANANLQRSIDELQALNQGLLDGIAGLRAELQSLRGEVAALNPDDIRVIEPVPELVPRQQEYGHILVPHKPRRGTP